MQSTCNTRKDKHAKKEYRRTRTPLVPPGWEKVAARIKPVLEIVVKPKLKEVSGANSDVVQGSKASTAARPTSFQNGFLPNASPLWGEGGSADQPARTQVSGARNAALNITKRSLYRRLIFTPPTPFHPIAEGGLGDFMPGRRRSKTPSSRYSNPKL